MLVFLSVVEFIKVVSDYEFLYKIIVIVVYVVLVIKVGFYVSFRICFVIFF